MMADTINKVCVIGAGVMGAGIAAQVANAGVPVLLLDIVPKDGADRDAIAKGAVAKMLKTEPAAFMSPAAAKLVETGNIEDHRARSPSATGSSRRWSSGWTSSRRFMPGWRN